MKHEEQELQKEIVGHFRELLKYDEYAYNSKKKYKVLNKDCSIVSNINEIPQDTPLKSKIVKLIKDKSLKSLVSKTFESHFETQRILRNKRANQSGRIKGEADLMLTYKHREFGVHTIAYVELKTFDAYSKKNHNLSEDQIKFSKICEAKGIPYFVCYSPSTFFSVLEELKIIELV